ncbi:interleukin 36 beta [Rhinolophus ferrumequinum]|uniref:Interleukin-1 n=2 Tax=Rhinolophus ferrumequinum TaxID=59479 RepID=A0A7J7QX70_RHIFE|nr:interleukin-36 beta [Rhinolophus ferrumequinum]KAF6268466.1 interleukin 36 beta [Rhinolophus ferrumequinum]
MDTPQKVEIPESHRIRDSLQMVWVLKGNTLFSVPFSSNVEPVTICSVPCTDTESHDEQKGSLIYLGLKGVDLCLFCAEIQGHPTLQLKEKKIMDLHEEKSAQKPFLFLRGIEGSTSTFQSVAYPGWFIATSSTVGQPVILTNERGKTYNTNFYFSPEELIRPR